MYNARRQKGKIDKFRYKFMLYIWYQCNFMFYAPHSLSYHAFDELNQIYRFCFPYVTKYKDGIQEI